MSNRKHKNYSRDFKIEAVKLVLAGDHKVGEAANRLGVSKSSLSKWTKDYQSSNFLEIFPGKGYLRPESTQIKALEKELARVRQERDILKKAMAYFAAPQK